ncbi:helix-turn-helix domain-containing protein [Myroides odoratus]|uniref:helix-turn-helix domain-containing protein n=1 Tax=Myroides odoratus TaxID=256 RepID=UPI0039AF13CC
MKILKFHKTECGVEFLLNVIHLTDVDESYLKAMPFTTDFFEVLFFKRGKGQVSLNHDTIDLVDASIVFISPFQKRQWMFIGDEQEVTILLFQEDFLNEFFEDKLFAYRLLYFYQLNYPLHISLQENSFENYWKILQEIKGELVDTQSDSIHIVRSLLYYILQKLNREYAIQNALAIERDENHYAFQFKLLIEKHIREKQRVGEYAVLLGISRISLNKAVMKQFHVTATHLIKQRLLLEIKNYLVHSSLTVNEIAYQLHFSESNHLMRFFKKQTGYTTSEFLKEHQTATAD